jgi:hypothetical protein
VSLNITGILDAVVTHASEIGRFDVVNRFETKRAPGQGMTASIWVNSVNPIQSSGLATTTTRIEFTVRIYLNSLQQPYDDNDTLLTQTLDALFAAYIDNFTLGGLVRHVDIFGAYGQGLVSRAGYINQDGHEFRVMSITLPVLVDDLWDQVP